MRIFCAIRHSNDPKQFYGGLWSGNFYPALRELGHELIESKTDLLPTSRFMNIGGDFTDEEREMRAQTTGRIVDEVRVAHKHAPVDLFLSYFYNSHFDPGGFDELRRLGIPSVNFYCNSIYQFNLVADIAAKADFSWHAERDARQSYFSVGAKPVWVQMGADPNVYYPVTGIRRESKSCFIGQRYADRDRWMAALVRSQVPVDIYGPGWGAASNQVGPATTAIGPGVYLGRSQISPGSRAGYIAELRETMQRDGLFRGLARIGRQLRYRNKTRKLAQMFKPHARGAVPFEKIAEIFSSYELCLNFSNVWSDGRPASPLIPHVRLRDFEAPMCRTCYLTGHTEEIAEFYEIGREIEIYRTPDELVEKARFFLAHPESAEKLREAGYRRALKDHTWKQRFKELFLKIGIMG
jgi:spore maturation protein CgeB